MTTPSEKSQEPSSNWLNVVKESTTIATAIAGLFVALVWVLGRIYLKGYFETINIPTSQVSLSLWEYGELGWSLLLTLIFLVIFTVTIEFVIHSPARLFTRYLANRFHFDRKRHTTSKYIITYIVWIVAGFIIPSKFIPGTASTEVKITVYAILLLILLLTSSSPLDEKRNLEEEPHRQSRINSRRRIDNIIFLSLVSYLLIAFLISSAYDYGTIDGRFFVTEKALKARFLLSGPLLVGIPSIEQKLGTNTIASRYDDLYVLLNNDHHYFVFKFIDSQCEPEKVYVIKEENVLSIEYMSSVPLKTDCIPAAAMPTITQTPTPTAKPTSMLIPKLVVLDNKS